MHEVIIGNIGRVYRGNSSAEACKHYLEGVCASMAQHGRASGESVLWFDGVEIKREHVPPQTVED